MQYKIIYDKYNRLRVRCGDNAFTHEQACGIAELLGEKEYVKTAETNYRTGSILVEYAPGKRREVLKLIAGLDKANLPSAQVPALSKAAENFKGKLAKMLVKRFLMRFIPMPIKRINIIYSALKYVFKAVDHLLQMKLDVAVLDGTAIGVSTAIGNYSTASSIMFLLKLSDLLEEYTRQKTKLALSEQLSINVETVWLSDGDELRQIPFKNVKVGDKILVRTGSVIPFDGLVCGHEAMVNQSTMTGESEPVHKSEGDSVFAGTTIESGKLIISVRTLAENSRLQEIINMIDESEDLKASIQSNAEHLADNIVPYSFIGFALAFGLTRNFTRALSVLMVDFSCAIKLSTPISVISAMREAAEHGITVKGGKYLEAYAQADTLVFDKTGTLTNASPKVVDVVPFNGFDSEYVLRTSACLEEHFPHSVANAVVACASEKGLTHEEEHAEVEYLVAHGIVTTLHGQRAVIGSSHFIFEDENVPVTDEQKQVIKQKSVGNSVIFLAVGGKLAGMLVIDDPVRKEAGPVVKALRKAGIERVCMLTGDTESAAKRVSDSLGLDWHTSQVLPDHKSSYVKALQSNGHKVIMVGDGINDAPALAAADVSVAMSDGSDIAREVADIALCNDKLYELVTLRKLSVGLIERIHKNYRFIVGFNAGLIALGVMGILPPTLSALLHNGSTLAIAASSMKKLIDKEKEEKDRLRALRSDEQLSSE